MISAEVQRTLVKSPPELWAELSDPEAIARHLGELGEIRITRAEPEQKVEWDAGEISGAAMMEPSGWGTKVTLSATRATPEAGPAAGADPCDGDVSPAEGDAAPAEQDGTAAQTQRSSEATPVLEEEEPSVEDALAELAGEASPPVEEGATAEDAPAEAGAAENTTPPAGDTTAIAAPQTFAEPAATAAEGPAPVPERRPGFFARLFARRRTTSEVSPGGQDSGPPAPDTTALPAPTGEPAEPNEQAPPAGEARTPAPPDEEPTDVPEPGAATMAVPLPGVDDRASDEPIAEEPPTAPEPTLDAAEGPSEAPSETIARDLRDAEETAVAEVTALLTAALDSLGAAHHRPFSRA